MRRPAIAEEQKAAAKSNASTELMYLLARQEVSEENQVIFFHAGVTIEKFASFAKDRDDLVKVLKDSWELDQARSLDARVQVAGIFAPFKMQS